MGLKKIGVVLGILFIISLNGSANNVSVKVTKEQSNDRLESVILENSFLKVKIIRRDGKVINFIDKRTGHNLVSSEEEDIWSGFCKERDWKFPMQRHY